MGAGRGPVLPWTRPAKWMAQVHGKILVSDEFFKPFDTKDIETTTRRMSDELPVYLLSRSLAEEGLALVEQIRWEARFWNI